MHGRSRDVQGFPRLIQGWQERTLIEPVQDNCSGSGHAKPSTPSALIGRLRATAPRARRTRLAGIRYMSDADGSGIRGRGSDQTGCHYGVRIDLAGDGDQRKYEDDPNCPHG